MTLAEIARTGASDSSKKRLDRTVSLARKSSPTTSRASPSSRTFFRPSRVSDAAVSRGTAMSETIDVISESVPMSCVANERNVRKMRGK